MYEYLRIVGSLLLPTNMHVHHFSLRKKCKYRNSSKAVVSLCNLNKKNKANLFNIKTWFLISKLFYIAFALWLPFILSTFSVQFWRVVWSAPVSVQCFSTRSQKNVLWFVSASQLKLAFTWLYLVLKWLHWCFCVSRIGVKEIVE